MKIPGAFDPTDVETIWDGLSLNTDRVSRDNDQSPNAEDYDRVIGEIIATQTAVVDHEDRVADLEATEAGGRVVGSLTNDNASSVVICEPVYLKSDGDIDKARANADGTSVVLGLCTGTIATTADGSVQTDGIFTATTAQWDAITGGTGGLTVGAEYFLSTDTAGRMTSTRPAVAARVALIGVAISSTKMLLRLGTYYVDTIE